MLVLSTKSSCCCFALKYTICQGKLLRVFFFLEEFLKRIDADDVKIFRGPPFLYFYREGSKKKFHVEWKSILSEVYDICKHIKRNANPRHQFSQFQRNNLQNSTADGVLRTYTEYTVYFINKNFILKFFCNFNVCISSKPNNFPYTTSLILAHEEMKASRYYFIKFKSL